MNEFILPRVTGTEAAEAAAASKASRGWKVDVQQELASLLPEPDLVEYRGQAIIEQLLEAAATCHITSKNYRK